MEEGRGFRWLMLWRLVLFLALTAVCSARQTVATLPGRNDGRRRLPAAEGRAPMTLGTVGTSDDYPDPEPNPRHTPPPSGGHGRNP